MARTETLEVRLKTPHAEQNRFIRSKARRKVIRAGRRGGKTVGISIYAVESFLQENRILYAAPTQDQTDTLWREVTVALDAPIKAKLYKINQTRRFIERTGTTQRIRAKTAWDADSMRGDWANDLVLEEWQLMKPEAWYEVGAPMLLDSDGTATFIYTPGIGEKGMHAREMYKYAEKQMMEALAKGEQPRWEVFHFTSFDNPHLSKVALDEISGDMSPLDYRREIMAEDIEDIPGALWTRQIIEDYRVDECPELPYMAVAIDPPATKGECGIVAGGRKQMSDGRMHAFIITDSSLRGRPDQWGGMAVSVYNQLEADRLIGEINNGGDMIENVIRSVPGGDNIAYKQVRASRGKATRAEPVAQLYAQGLVHHVGDPKNFQKLEDQYCTWVPGMAQSPDRLDAATWLVTDLLLGPRGWVRGAV